MKRLVLAIALFSWPIAARADTPRVRLSYRAPQGCPDENAFVAAVAAQARPFERAPRSAARVRSLEAAITSAAAGHIGVLRVREAGGATSERDVRGATCGEVFSALALVAAIAIDAGPPPPRPPPPDEPTPPARGPAPRWRWATAVHGGAFFSMAPGPSWGVAPALEAVPPLEGAPLVVRLGLSLATSPRIDTAAGSAEISWLTARLGLAVFHFSRGPFSLRPTAEIGAGVVRGHGFAIASPRDALRPWADVALGARAHVTVFPALDLELAGGLLAPLTRAIWVFESPDVIVHETPPVGGYLTFGARVTFAR